MSTDAFSIYQGVIEDVINNVREEFINQGYDESTLIRLQEAWLHKLANVSDQALESDFEDENLPMETPPPQYHQHSMPQVNYARPIGHTLPPLYGSMPMMGGAPVHQMAQIAHIVPTMSPAPLRGDLQQTHTLRHSPDSNDEYDEDEIPQNDGAGDAPARQLAASRKSPAVGSSSASNASSQGSIPQVDGGGDDRGAGKTATSNSSGSSRQYQRAPVSDADHSGEGSSTGKGAEEKKDDEELGSDLDDPDDAAEEVETNNIVVCQYEKVTRAKNKWRCNLKDGIMQLNGRDYLFSRATGDFEF